MGPEPGPFPRAAACQRGPPVLPRSHPVAGSEQLPAASVGPAGDLRPFLRPFLRRSPGALGRGQLHRTDICVLGSTGAAVTGQQLPLPPVPAVPRPSWRPPSGYRAGCPWTEILSGGHDPLPAASLGFGGLSGPEACVDPCLCPQRRAWSRSWPPPSWTSRTWSGAAASTGEAPGRPPRGTRLFPFAFLC